MAPLNAQIKIEKRIPLPAVVSIEPDITLCLRYYAQSVRSNEMVPCPVGEEANRCQNFMEHPA
jgi:hypothetical protein